MEIEKEIKENWFKDHKATLIQHDSLSVLDWRKPNSSFYAVRYIFDGYNLYISGDLGVAVFCLTWKGDVHSFNDIHIGYFTEKLRAFVDDRWDFNSDRAVVRLKEWIKDLKEYGIKYDKNTMRELIQRSRACSCVREWAEIVNSSEYYDFISDIDADYWEWFYNIGNEYPPRLRSYLIGLQMASAQLKG